MMLKNSDISDRALVPEKQRLVSDQQLEPTLDLINRESPQASVVRESLRSVLGHEWLKRDNMLEGKSHLEALFHSVYNRIPKQAEIHYKKIIDVYDQDRAEKAIKVARSVGIESRLFAVMEVEGVNFLVKGRDFDWNVWLIDFSDEEVPCKFLRRLTVLKNNGVEFDGFAIAVPHQTKYQPVVKVMTQEAVKIGRKGVIGLGKVAKAVNEGITAIHEAIRLKDPVILGRYGRFWLEIGRWE